MFHRKKESHTGLEQQEKIMTEFTFLSEKYPFNFQSNNKILQSCDSGPHLLEVMNFSLCHFGFCMKYDSDVMSSVPKSDSAPGSP